jgi:hypothetical protein
VANANKGKAQYASAGNGTPQHMTGELFKTAANLKDLTHVPYKGAAPGDHRRARRPRFGHLRQHRGDPSAPQGRKAHPDRDHQRQLARPAARTCRRSRSRACRRSSPYAWYGFFAPAKTPKDVIDKLNAEAQKAMKSPEYQAVLKDTGLRLRRRHAANFAKFIAAEHAKWGEGCEG